MYYNNKNYDEIWKDVDESSAYKKIMVDVLKHLPAKDLLFIQHYYYMGLSEQEIAPILGYSNQSSVSDFKDRIFARITAYVHRELLFLPKCITDVLRAQNVDLYDNLRILLNPNTINNISEDKYYKNMFFNIIDKLEKYIEQNILSCNADCVYHTRCCKLLEKNKDETLNKVIGIKEYFLKTNLLFLIKFLRYLLNWRVFSEID